MFNRQQHEYFLKKILLDIFNEPRLNSQLVFKGGTCLYLFYDLERFSVDLDFNFIGDGKFSAAILTQILEKYLILEENSFREGHFGWLWEGSYQKGYRRLQVDINKRQYPDHFETRQLYGLSIQTLDESSLFAHKLCAVLDRTHFKNRDLFDVHFMLDHSFEINEDIIELRTGLDLKQYLRKIEAYVENEVDGNKILQGLGELLTDKKKNWVKAKLIDELLIQLRLKIESL